QGNNGDPDAMLANNPLFNVADKVSVNCALPAFQSSGQGLEDYLRAAVPCVSDMWKQTLQKASISFREPNVQFPTGTTVNSPCGTVSIDETPAFYCGTDQTLYLMHQGFSSIL